MRRNCNDCEEFLGRATTECSYSCVDKIKDRLETINEHRHNMFEFSLELYNKSGIYVSPSSIYKNKNLLEEYL